MRFESRDPFQEKLKREDQFDSDWDRFANMEYHRLAAEEEGGYTECAIGGMDVESLAAQRSSEQFSGWQLDDDDVDDDDDSHWGGGGVSNSNTSRSSNNGSVGHRARGK